MALFMGMLPNPMLTTDQVKILHYDNVIKENELADGTLTFADLDLQPIAMENVVPNYLVWNQCK